MADLVTSSQLSDHNWQKLTLPTTHLVHNSPCPLAKMCLKALTSFVSEIVAHLNLPYARAINFTENGLMFVVEVETDCVANDTPPSAHTEPESNKAVAASEAECGALDRLVRKLRPSNQLQRNTSKASVASASSQRLHEYLKLQESLSSFPSFQEESSLLFWRKPPTKGKHRSLQGKTVLRTPH